jgi:hypothetical protein
MDGTTRSLTGKISVSKEEVLMGACANCDYNYDRDRTHAPINSCPETGKTLVKCKSQADDRQKAIDHMLPAKVGLERPEDCEHYKSPNSPGKRL